MDQNYKELIGFLLPAGILDYFDLIKTTQSPNGLHIYLEERNDPPAEYKDVKLHSKGFMDETRIQDFPIRGQKVTLVIKGRRWEIVDTHQVVSRDWHLVTDGTRITKEFGLFLKETFRR